MSSSNKKFAFAIGFSATTGDLKCPECDRVVKTTYRPFRDDDLEVCAFCFDKVEERGRGSVDYP